MVISKGKILATEVNLPPQTLHFIDLLLNISNLVILNPLITICCQNGVVALGLECFVRFLSDQNFPPSKFMGSVILPSLMKSIVPQKSLSLFSARLLSIDSTSDLCDSQLWALNLLAFQFFYQIPRWKIHIILGLGHKSCQTIIAQYHAHFGYLDDPTMFDLWWKIHVG